MHGCCGRRELDPVYFRQVRKPSLRRKRRHRIRIIPQSQEVLEALDFALELLDFLIAHLDLCNSVSRNVRFAAAVQVAEVHANVEPVQASCRAWNDLNVLVKTLECRRAQRVGTRLIAVVQLAGFIRPSTLGETLPLDEMYSNI